MIETPNAALNEQGQLASDQRASIGGWLSRQQLRAVPSVLPLAVVVAVGALAGGVLNSRGLTDTRPACDSAKRQFPSRWCRL